MAQPFRLLIFSAAALAGASVNARAQAPDPAAAPLDPNAAPGDRAALRRNGVGSAEFGNVRKALEALTPEQIKRFQENFQRWSNLSPEEKKALRDQDEVRRKRIQADIELAMKEAGLVFTRESREMFVKRYAEERRKVEELLRKEMEEKRQVLLKDVRERLKVEFSAPASKTP